MTNFHENVKLKGNVSIIVTDEKDQVVFSDNITNLVVRSGREYIADFLLGNTSVSAMSHMGLGSNSTPVTESDISLYDEVVRIPFFSKSAGTGSNSHIITFTAFFDANTLSFGDVPREIGIFNANSDGTMLCRTVFPPFDFDEENFTININWQIAINV